MDNTSIQIGWASTMPACCRLALSPTSRQRVPMVALPAAQAPLHVRGNGTVMPVLGGYVAPRTTLVYTTVNNNIATTNTTVPAARVLGCDADHKFSTRLGPTASPPV